MDPAAAPAPSETPKGSEGSAETDAPRLSALSLLRRNQPLQILLAVVVVSLTTLAPIAFVAGAPPLASVLAAAALLAGFAGAALVGGRPRIARFVGISLFAACSVGAWLAASPALDPGRMDPLRGVLGAAAWGIFALTWSDRWTIPSSAELLPQGAALPARATLPPAARFIAGLGVLAALAVLALAWTVRHPERALLAQCAALASAAGLIGAGASIATGRSRTGPAPRAGLGAPARRALLGLLALALGGLFAWLSGAGR